MTSWWNSSPGESASGVTWRAATPARWIWKELAGPAPRPKAKEEGPRTNPSPVEVEAERQRAYEAGFRDGSAFARRQILEELGPNLRASVEVVEEVESYLEAFHARMEENLTALALAVARQLVERELRADPQVVADLVRNALTHFPMDQKVRIRLHPADLSAISREGQGAPPTIAAGREVQWIPDESVARGGCLVEGPERIVDGRIDAALERIFRTVTRG